MSATEEQEHFIMKLTNPASRGGALLFVTVLALFVLFPSQQRNSDGPLQDIARITAGQIDPGARHFLYSIVGVPYYKLWRWAGYAGDAAYPMQLLNAVCGALGALGIYVFFRQISRRSAVGLLAALAYACSYGYWCFTADVFYNVFTLVPVIWSLPLLYAAVHTPQPRRRLILALSLAFLTALAVAGTQEHLLFLLVVAAGLLLPSDEDTASFRSRVQVALVYLVVAAGSVLLINLVAASVLGGCRSLSCIAAWIRPYGEVMIPMYGQISPERIPAAMQSFLATIVPLWRGLALRDLAHNVITPDRLVGQLALAGSLLILIVTLGTLVVSGKSIYRERRFLLLLCIIWLAVYTPPIIWLDPFGPERWILPLVPAFVLVYLAYEVFARRASQAVFRWIPPAITLVVLLICLSNFTLAIWPDFRHPNPDILAARYAATQMTESDILISPRWDWSLYLESEKRQAVNLPTFSLAVGGRVPDPEKLLQAIDRQIAHAHASGGRAFVVDFSAYTDADWLWIRQNTGLGPEHFRRYPLQLAWQDGNVRVWQIISATSGMSQ